MDEESWRSDVRPSNQTTKHQAHDAARPRQTHTLYPTLHGAAYGMGTLGMYLETEQQSQGAAKPE